MRGPNNEIPGQSLYTHPYYPPKPKYNFEFTLSHEEDHRREWEYNDVESAFDITAEDISLQYHDFPAIDRRLGIHHNSGDEFNTGEI